MYTWHVFSYSFPRISGGVVRELKPDAARAREVPVPRPRTWQRVFAKRSDARHGFRLGLSWPRSWSLFLCPLERPGGHAARRGRKARPPGCGAFHATPVTRARARARLQPSQEARDQPKVRLVSNFGATRDLFHRGTFVVCRILMLITVVAKAHTTDQTSCDT